MLHHKRRKIKGIQKGVFVPPKVTRALQGECMDTPLERAE
jgi:hypothetical protein